MCCFTIANKIQKENSSVESLVCVEKEWRGCAFLEYILHVIYVVGVAATIAVTAYGIGIVACLLV